MDGFVSVDFAAVLSRVVVGAADAEAQLTSSRLGTCLMAHDQRADSRLCILDSGGFVGNAC